MAAKNEFPVPEKKELYSK